MKDLVSFVKKDKIKEGEYKEIEREGIGGDMQPERHV